MRIACADLVLVIWVLVLDGIGYVFIEAFVDFMVDASGFVVFFFIRLGIWNRVRAVVRFFGLFIFYLVRFCFI